MAVKLKSRSRLALAAKSCFIRSSSTFLDPIDRAASDILFAYQDFSSKGIACVALQGVVKWNRYVQSQK